MRGDAQIATSHDSSAPRKLPLISFVGIVIGITIVVVVSVMSCLSWGQSGMLLGQET